MSSDEITIIIPGPPAGKERPRFTKWGQAYTPDKTREREEEIALLAKMAMRGRKPFTGPVRVDVTAVFRPPLSWRKPRISQALAGGILPTVKPDRDNIEKLVCDAMNGIVFVDDKQAVCGETCKIYGETSRVIVTVRPVLGAV